MAESTTLNGAAASVRSLRKAKGKAKAKPVAVKKKAVRSTVQIGLLKDAGERLAALRDRAGDVAGSLRSTLQTAAGGLRAVNLQAVEYMHGDADRLFKAAKATLKAKSLREALEIQGDFVRAQVTTQIRQVRDLGALSADHARETIAPITKALRGKPVRKAA